MADLAIKVGDRGRDAWDYRDGDIVCAFGPRRIRAVHAEHLCDVRRAGFTAHGLHPSGSLAQDFREAVCRYRFQRLSRTDVLRTDLTTGQSDVFGPVPRFVDGHWRHIYLEEHLRRRLSHAGHAVFEGMVWYGGTEDRSDAALDVIWNAIETKTDRRESEPIHQYWPAGRLDLAHFLWVTADDCDDATAERLMLEQPHARRSYRVDRDSRIGDHRAQSRRLRELIAMKPLIELAA